MTMISAVEALDRLREGNRRFTSNNLQHCSIPAIQTHLNELVAGQEPFAIILGCADSRVPAEIIFDQGLGDLFDIRVAGNIVTPSQVGSAEFAAKRFGTRLVVVLGHSGCGAVSATLEELKNPTEVLSPHLRMIVNRIRPAVEGILDSKPERNGDTLLKQAVRSNIRASVNHLRNESQILRELMENSGLIVVGAEYSVKTGIVDFFDSFNEE